MKEKYQCCLCRFTRDHGNTLKQLVCATVAWLLIQPRGINGCLSVAVCWHGQAPRDGAASRKTSAVTHYSPLLVTKSLLTKVCSALFFSLRWLILMCRGSTRKSLQLFPLHSTRPRTPGVPITDVPFILPFWFLASANARFRGQAVAVLFEKISPCLIYYLGAISVCSSACSLLWWLLRTKLPAVMQL